MGFIFSWAETEKQKITNNRERNLFINIWGLLFHTFQTELFCIGRAGNVVLSDIDSGIATLPHYKAFNRSVLLSDRILL